MRRAAAPPRPGTTPSDPTHPGRPTWPGRIGACLLALVLVAGAAGAAETLMPRPRPPLPPAMTLDPRLEADRFAMPRITASLRAALGLIRAGDLEGRRAGSTR